MKKGIVIFCLLCSIILPSWIFAAKSDDGLAGNMYKSAMAFYKEGKYEEALKDFDSILQKFPTSNWAAMSLFQKGIYYKEVGSNPEEAKSSFEKLVQDFPQHKKATQALLKIGEIQLDASDDINSLNAPLATFERLIRTYPWSENTAEAAYKAAGIYFRINNINKAMEKIKLIDERFAASSFYPDAVLLRAMILTADGEYVQAAKDLQNIVTSMNGTDQAVKAKKYLNAIQRFKLENGYKYKIDSSFKLDQSQPVASPKKIYIDELGQILLFDSESKMVYMFDDKGTFANSDAPSCEAIDYTPGKTGAHIFVDSSGNIEISGQTIPLNFMDGENSRQVIKPREICVNSFGDIFVVSRRGEHIFRFDPEGNFKSRISKHEFDNIIYLALDNFSRLYTIDDSYEGILIFNLTGLEAGKIPLEGRNYKMKEPVSIKFDKFNHMVVYDKGINAFLVFDNNHNFIKQIPVEYMVEDVSDFALSDAGEIYILDEDQKTVHKLF